MGSINYHNFFLSSCIIIPTSGFNFSSNYINQVSLNISHNEPSFFIAYAKNLVVIRFLFNGTIYAIVVSKISATKYSNTAVKKIVAYLEYHSHYTVYLNILPILPTGKIRLDF